LPEVAKSLGLQVQTSPPVTAEGRIYARVGEMIDPALQPILQTAFTMQEGDPQVAESDPGKTFVIYEVGEIAASAPAPLNEIVNDVKVAYALDKGSLAAKAAAQSMQAAVRKGEKLDVLLAKLGKKLPPIERVGMTRPELSRIQQSGRQVPPPITLLFAMAQGSVKVQEAPQQRGWFVVVLDKIEQGKMAANDPAVTATRHDLGKIVGTEYADALRKAITKSVGVKRNEAAIAALRDELTGNTGG
jgi:peptidyl-prolyl cis-trans isomerase D